MFMCMISWMIHSPCDQLAVGTQNCFSTLFYTPYRSSFLACNSRLRSLILTLKQAPRMHQNATLPYKKSKNFMGSGNGPLLKPLPYWRGNTRSPDSNPLGTFGASILAPSALGVPVPFHLRLEHCYILTNHFIKK